MYLYLVLTMKKGVVREKKKIGKSESNWEKEDQWRKHKGGGATASPGCCSGLSHRAVTSPTPGAEGYDSPKRHSGLYY